MYVIAFNGPPRSGKDTLAGMVATWLDRRTDLPVKEVSLSTPLRKIAFAMVGWDYDDKLYETFKTIQFPQFGVSGRQLMIDVSESFLKQKYGITIMAKMLLDDLIGFDGIVLIRDSGFQIEIDPIVDVVGEDNLLVARVVRDGCSFAGDSREWVYHKHEDVISNNGSLERLDYKADLLTKYLTHNLKWNL